MSLSVQFYTMLAMIAMGSFFGGTLDTYNRFLQRRKRKRWVVFVHDVLFWLCQSLLLFYVLFLVNAGEVRFYIFIALLCGFAAYQALFKNGYLKLLEWCIQAALPHRPVYSRHVPASCFPPGQRICPSFVCPFSRRRAIALYDCKNDGKNGNMDIKDRA